MNFKGKRRIFILGWVMFLFVAPGCKKECDFWVEGKKCDTEVRLEYYGAYDGIIEETAGIGPLFINGFPNATVSIVEYPGDAKRLYLTDPIYEQMFIVLTEKNEFEIPFQVFEFTGGNIETVRIRGNGSFSENFLSYSLNLTLKVNDGTEFSESQSFEGSK